VFSGSCLLEFSRSSKDETLLAGSDDLSAALEHKDKLKRNKRSRLTHVLEVDDAIALGTKEQRWIQPALTLSKRTSD